jgi:hypothetical protein
MEEIADAEINGKTMKIIKNENGFYDIFVNDELKQPNHDAEGIMRYLMLCLHNLDYQKQKIQQEAKKNKI